MPRDIGGSLTTMPTSSTLPHIQLKVCVPPCWSQSIFQCSEPLLLCARALFAVTLPESTWNYRSVHTPGLGCLRHASHPDHALLFASQDPLRLRLGGLPLETSDSVLVTPVRRCPMIQTMTSGMRPFSLPRLCEMLRRSIGLTVACKAPFRCDSAGASPWFRFLFFGQVLFTNCHKP